MSQLMSSLCNDDGIYNSSVCNDDSFLKKMSSRCNDDFISKNKKRRLDIIKRHLRNLRTNFQVINGMMIKNR